MTAKEKYQEAQTKLAAAKAEAQAVMKQSFDEGAAALFEKYPNLYYFSWCQYTPYFNDGGTCEFSAYVDSDGIRVRWKNPEGSAEKTTLYIPYEYEPKDAPVVLADAIVEIATFLKEFSEADLEAMFGDHVEVKVRATGTKTEDYEHD